MKDYKESNLQTLMQESESNRSEAVISKPQTEQPPENNKPDKSMLPKTPTGTRINQRGKNIIVLIGAALCIYIVWAIFGLSPKSHSTTTPQESINISASSLSNQQNQGQNLVNTLRNQAYGAGSSSMNAANPGPSNANNVGASAGLPPQDSIPGNLANIAAGAGSGNSSYQGDNAYTNYNNAGNNNDTTDSGDNSGQNPYQQTVQSGMQSSLTPDGFEGANQNNTSSDNSGNSNNNNIQGNNTNSALAANAAAIQAVASSGGNQNMQNEKSAFLQNNQTGGNDNLQNGVQNPASPYMIMAGSIIPATLITGINSDLPGQIQAIVSQNVYDTSTGNFVLIPQGSKLIGTYDSQVAYGQSRVLIVWSRVIFPNNQYIDLEGMPGADLTGAAGLTDQVNNHTWRIYSAAILMSLFSAGMQLSQPNINSMYGTPTNQQIIAGAMGQELGQVSTQMIQQNLNIQPTINIRAGNNFEVLVTRDIPFNGPYNDSSQSQVLLNPNT